MDHAEKVLVLAETLAFDAADWDTFEDVVALLTEREAWSQLDRAYRRMIHAVLNRRFAIDGRSQQDLERALWQALAVLYRDRLGDASRAIEAFKMVATLSPDDPEVQLEIATLCEQTGELDRAIEAYEALMRMGLRQPEAARGLFDVHMQRRAIDAAWCAAAVLDHYGVLEGSDRDFFEDYRPRRLGALAASLGEREWRKLLHEDADMLLVELFALTGPPPQNPAMAAPAARAYACRALGVAGGDEAEPLGPDSRLDDPVEGQRTRRELARAGFEAAQLRFGVPAAVPDLVVGYLAAARLSRPTAPVPPDLARAVELEASRLGAALDLPTCVRVAGIICERPSANLGKWREGIHATAVRAALLVAGDLGAAGELLTTTPEALTSLLAFMASTAHAELRALLGRAVDSPWRDRDGSEPSPSITARLASDELTSARRAGSSACEWPSIAARLESDDPEVVGRALAELRRGETFPDEVLALLETLLTDRRVYRKTSPEGPTYDAVCELAAEALWRAGPRGARPLRAALGSKHEVEIPVACYDQGSYIGDYSSRVVRLDNVAREALERIERDHPGAASAALQKEKSWRGVLSLPRQITMGDLETALGVVFEAGALAQGNMGRFSMPSDMAGDAGSAPLSPQIAGLTAAYAWDRFHEEPVASLDDLRRRRVDELSVRFTRGRAAIAAKLRHPMAEVRRVGGWEIYGSWLIDEPTGDGDHFTLRRHRVLPDWAVPGRPTGGPLEDHEGPPGGTHRLAPTDRVRRLVIGPAAAEPGEESPVREGDALASRIRAFPHDPALRAAYAEWLALRGFASECAYLQEITAVMALLEGGASRADIEPRLAHLTRMAATVDPDVLVAASAGRARFGGMLAIAPARLAHVEPPAQRPTRLWRDFDDLLRFDVLVLADFLGREGDRSLLDRRVREVTRDGFAKALAEARLRFSLTVEGRSIELAVESPADFEDAGRAGRLAAAGLSGAALESALDAFSRHEPLLRAERAWRSLWWLLDQAPRDVVVSFVHCSRNDLLEDLEHPEPARSDLLHVVHGKNHLAMDPRGLVVIDHAIDPTSARDERLAMHLAEIGRRRAVPMIAPLAPVAEGASVSWDYRKWRHGESASYLALCGPSFELRRSHRGVLPGHASFLAAALAFQSFERSLCGGPLIGSAGALQLMGAIDRERALDEGFFTFAATPAGATLASDASCRAAGSPERRSLSASLLVTRIAHHVADIDLRAGGSRMGDADVEAMTALFNERLAARFAGVEGVSAAVSELGWRSVGCLEATITVTVPSPIAASGLTLRERVLLRLDD